MIAENFFRARMSTRQIVQMQSLVDHFFFAERCRVERQIIEAENYLSGPH